MEKYYINYYHVDTLEANIIKKVRTKDILKIYLDRTIFMPSNKFFSFYTGYIDNKKLIDVREENGEIVHILNEDLDKSEVVLTLEQSDKFRSMDYTTALFLILTAVEKFYNRTQFRFNLKNDYAVLKIYDFDCEFDKLRIEEFTNYLVDLDLSIDYEKEHYILESLSSMKYYSPIYLNTKACHGIKIIDEVNEDYTLTLKFLAGNDLKKYHEINDEILTEIKKITFKDYDNVRKLNEIISIMKKQKLL